MHALCTSTVLLNTEYTFTCTCTCTCNNTCTSQWIALNMGEIIREMQQIAFVESASMNAGSQLGIHRLTLAK